MAFTRRRSKLLRNGNLLERALESLAAFLGFVRAKFAGHIDEPL